MSNLLILVLLFFHLRWANPTLLPECRLCSGEGPCLPKGIKGSSELKFVDLSRKNNQFAVTISISIGISVLKIVTQCERALMPTNMLFRPTVYIMYRADRPTVLLLGHISDEAGRRNETVEENCFLKIRKPSKHGMYEHMSASVPLHARMWVNTALRGVCMYEYYTY